MQLKKIHRIHCWETMAMWVVILHTQSRGLAAAVLGCLFKEIWEQTVLEERAPLPRSKGRHLIVHYKRCKLPKPRVQMPLL